LWKKILLKVQEVFVEKVGKVIAEEFFKEKVLHFRKNVDAALLAIESLQLCFVMNLLVLFIHGVCSLL
jgi:hypothetical protein